jgi:mycothiol synthase
MERSAPGRDLVWRGLTSDDAVAWSHLIDAIATADDTGEHFDPEDLAEEIDDECVGVFDGERMVAFGQLWSPVRRHDGTIRATFLGGVHPDHRGRGIGSALLGRLESRVVERARLAFPGADPPPATHAFASAISARDLLEANGYEVIRWFHDMVCAPYESDPDDRVTPYDREIDDEVRAAHTDAFAVHWGSAPPDDESWRLHGTGSRTFRPELSVLAVADGRVRAYSLVYQFEPDVVWIGQLGVRADSRGQGLGRAVLLGTLALAKRAGLPTVKLSVDTENPTQAGRLYESAGFERERSYSTYERRGARPVTP